MFCFSFILLMVLTYSCLLYYFINTRPLLCYAQCNLTLLWRCLMIVWDKQSITYNIYAEQLNNCHKLFHSLVSLCLVFFFIFGQSKLINHYVRLKISRRFCALSPKHSECQVMYGCKSSIVMIWSN